MDSSSLYCYSCLHRSPEHTVGSRWKEIERVKTFIAFLVKEITTQAKSIAVSKSAESDHAGRRRGACYTWPARPSPRGAEGVCWPVGVQCICGCGWLFLGSAPVREPFRLSLPSPPPACQVRGMFDSVMDCLLVRGAQLSR